VDGFVATELQAAKSLAELAHRRLRGLRFSAFAEAPRLAGLVLLLNDLNMTPSVLGVTHFRLGGRKEVEATLAEHGVSLPDDVVWLTDPTPQAVRALAGDGQSRPALEGTALVMGTTIERELLADSGVPFLEFGFPSEHRHFLQPAPWLGYRGALRFAEQVMQTVTRRA
jgi:nitrogenase molybdenum-iron protein alpha/beta subunit